MKNTCCFTGPRPKNYPREYTQKDFENYIEKQLACEIEMAISRGYRTFITGMAIGVDTIAAEIILSKKEKNPNLGLKLICAIPNRFQAKKWLPEQVDKYQEILQKGDKVVYISESFSVESYFDRNKYMVDNSSLVIAVDVNSNGARQTMEYAKEKNKEVRVIRICTR